VSNILNKKITIDELIDFMGRKIIRIIGDRNCGDISKPSPIQDRNQGNTISFLEKKHITNAEKLLAQTGASAIIMPSILSSKFPEQSGKTLIFVESPRIEFARIIQHFFVEPADVGIHPNAIVEQTAIIGENVYIGAGAVIGSGCIIGARAHIGSGVKILNKTIVGANCTIHPGAIIGSEGFHFHYNQSNELERFPHLAKVVIDENVEVGANASIDRGTLTDTLIGQSTKIDNLVHIGHSTQIGKRCRIVALSLIAGNAKVGDDVWIGAAVTISNNVTIGDRAAIGIGSVVVRDVQTEEHVSGYYAIRHSDFVRDNIRRTRSN